MTKRKKIVDLSHTIPCNPTDVWSNDQATLYFFDRYYAVEMYQKNSSGQVQHLTMTPQNYINFTCKLKQAGYNNVSVALAV